MTIKSTKTGWLLKPGKYPNGHIGASNRALIRALLKSNQYRKIRTKGAIHLVVIY